MWSGRRRDLGSVNSGSIPAVTTCRTSVTQPIGTLRNDDHDEAVNDSGNYEFAFMR